MSLMTEQVSLIYLLPYNVIITLILGTGPLHEAVRFFRSVILYTVYVYTY